MNPIAVISTEDLMRLVRDAVAAELATLAPRCATTLLTRDEAAQYLGVSVRQVDLLRDKAGLPTRWVGDSPRFDSAELDEWTKQPKTPGSRSAGSGTETSGKTGKSRGSAEGIGRNKKAQTPRPNGSAHLRGDAESLEQSGNGVGR